MSVEGLEGKGYRTPLSPAGKATRIVLAHKEREMIRMIADGSSLQFITQRLELGEIQLWAGLDSVFAKLAMLGRLELLSPKKRGKDQCSEFALVNEKHLAYAHRFLAAREHRDRRRGNDKRTV
jgi:DNA-binding CsgD family transcriptional regulator